MSARTSFVVCLIDGRIGMVKKQKKTQFLGCGKDGCRKGYIGPVWTKRVDGSTWGGVPIERFLKCKCLLDHEATISCD